MPKYKKYVRYSAIGVLIGCSGGAFAQSKVTLYGVLDNGILYTSRTFNPKSGASGPHQFSDVDGGISGSRIGFAGSEDLGGGAKAIFALESGFDTNNGAFGNSNGNFFGRLAYVGVSSNFGTVKAGVQYSPFALSIIDTDSRGASYFGAQTVIYLGGVFTTALFTPNAVSYTSPLIAGLQGSAMMALGGAAGDFQAGRQYAARLRYEWKDLVVNAALFSGNSGGAAESTPVPTTVAFVGRTIGADYQLGNAQIRASFTTYKIAGSFDNKVYSTGVQYTFTPSLTADAGAWIIRDSNNTSNHSLLTAVGLYYSLSKRTTLYSQGALVNNHGLLHTGISSNGALYEPTGTSTGVMFGIRHKF
ncbi:porin [Paraburkholderia sediminicola]